MRSRSPPSLADASSWAASCCRELTIPGQTTFLFREYALIVPLDIERQPLRGEAFGEIATWRSVERRGS